MCAETAHPLEVGVLERERETPGLRVQCHAIVGGDSSEPCPCGVAGGVTVSFFEWVQNLQNFRWDEADVNRRLDDVMTQVYALPLSPPAYTAWRATCAPLHCLRHACRLVDVKIWAAWSGAALQEAGKERGERGLVKIDSVLGAGLCGVLPDPLGEERVAAHRGFHSGTPARDARPHPPRL